MENALRLSIGLYDDPERQMQDHYILDLYRSNFAIFGSSMSGKTTLLKTILIRIHQVCALTDKEEIYILDFGNNMAEFSSLPYVVACFDATHEENVRRIFNRVEERYVKNVKDLKGKSYLQCSEQDRPPHITFVIDGMNSFLSEDKFMVYHDTLQRLSRDGLSKGVSIVFAANESSGGVHRLLASFKHIAALDLPKDAYSDLFGRRIEKPMSIKGRGLVNSEDGVYEFQAYLPYNPICADSELVEITGIISKMREYSGETGRTILEKCKNRKMKYFTEDLVKGNWGKYTAETWEDYQKGNEYKDTELIAGLEYYNLEPIKIDITHSRSIAIYGKKNSGKTNLLSLILEAAAKIDGVRFVVLEDGRKGVEDPQKAPSVAAVFENFNSTVCYCRSCDEFEGFLKTEGYYDVPKSMAGRMMYLPEDDIIEQDDKKFPEQEHPFTVFVIQSRLFYQTTPGGHNVQLIPRIDRFVCNESAVNKKLFIFSDVQKISDDMSATIFNNWIDHAFLLDDIVGFINSPRGHNSVFASQDIDELKERFGKCELGDGFYLDLERVELTKLKFIKQEGE